MIAVLIPEKFLNEFTLWSNLLKVVGPFSKNLPVSCLFPNIWFGEWRISDASPRSVDVSTIPFVLQCEQQTYSAL